MSRRHNVFVLAFGRIWTMRRRDWESYLQQIVIGEHPELDRWGRMLENPVEVALDFTREGAADALSDSRDVR